MLVYFPATLEALAGADPPVQRLPTEPHPTQINLFTSHRAQFYVLLLLSKSAQIAQRVTAIPWAAAVPCLLPYYPYPNPRCVLPEWRRVRRPKHVPTGPYLSRLRLMLRRQASKDKVADTELQQPSHPIQLAINLTWQRTIQ
jgi:hypothetical protein